MDAAMKAVSAAYPLSEVVGLRYAAGTVFSVAVFVAVGETMPGRMALLRNLLRAVVVLLTAASFFTAIARLPLAEAIALTFLAPLFLSLLGRLILSEPIPARIVLGLVLGLAGVVVIGAGQTFDAAHAFDLIGIAAAVSCAFFYALSNVLVRKQSGTDSVFTIVALSNVFVFLLTSPVMVFRWQAPSGGHVVVFLAAGLLGTCGHMCLAWAYARAPAGKLGLLEYSAFVWASLLGFFFFAEIPTVQTVIGAVIIVVACVLPGWRRAKLA
jgi:S-adenosylmethionine uptake transporter